jgi:hypothetical protein
VRYKHGKKLFNMIPNLGFIGWLQEKKKHKMPPRASDCWSTNLKLTNNQLVRLAFSSEAAHRLTFLAFLHDGSVEKGFAIRANSGRFLAQDTGGCR